jgi:hypothetical protein
MIPKKPAPDLIRGVQRFSEKIMPQQLSECQGNSAATLTLAVASE